jgi:hypothetical protein
VRLALGGHEWAMADYYEVAGSTYETSVNKVERVLDECGKPHTIYELARRLYDDLGGYGELLKVEQVGARIEYLNQRGLVMIDNLEAVEQDTGVPHLYRRIG